jgi:hypothetical protein
VETSERKKSLTAAHQEASRRLRLNHEYEFHSLLEDIYAEREINVQKRLTGSRKVSIKIMSWVLDHSPYEGKARLIHVVLADHANDEGICWPRQDQIAARAGCSVEHVRVTVKQMISDGYVEIVAASKGRGSSHRYFLKTPSHLGYRVMDHPKWTGYHPKWTGLSPQIPPLITVKNHQ